MVRRILRSKGTEAGMLRFPWWVGGAKHVANQGDAADSRGKWISLPRLLGPLAPLAPLQRLWSRKRRLIARSSDNLTWGRGARSCSNEYAGFFLGPSHEVESHEDLHVEWDGR